MRNCWSTSKRPARSSASTPQREILRRGRRPAFVKGLGEIAASGKSLASRVAALFTLEQLLGNASHETLLGSPSDDDLREFAAPRPGRPKRRGGRDCRRDPS